MHALTTDPIALDRPFVSPIIVRHAEDAAFYWSALDKPAEATHLSARRARHFAQLLDANLEGLRLNMPRAFELAANCLDRWGKSGEAFVAMYCALLGEGGEKGGQIDRVMATIRRKPDALVRGAASALAWATEDVAVDWISTALTSQESVDLVIALRACVLRDLQPQAAMPLINHAEGHVRAAACRLIGASRIDLLQTLLTDSERVVRAEAAIAWSAGAQGDARSAEQLAHVSRVFWQCIVEQASLLEAATGWYQVPARRRLDRWLREFAALVPVGHLDVGRLMTFLPLRQALNFTLHHGDPALLKFVVDSMGDANAARWAGWVWQCMTAVDLRLEGLVMEEPPFDLDAPMAPAQADADAGLPLPDPQLVRAHPANFHGWPDDRRLLLARTTEPHLLRDLIDPSRDHAQALRFIAADALSRLYPEYALNVRACPDVQANQLRRMGLAVAD